MDISKTPIRAICPGSFDPVTCGHLDIIQRASVLFDEVIVAVATDAGKQHMFNLEERMDMAQDAVGKLLNVRVESFSGLVVNYARQTSAKTLIKGLRSAADLEHESQMAGMNNHLAPEIETLYLIADPGLRFLSSSLMKHVIALGGDVSDFVTPLVYDKLCERLKTG